MNEYLFQDQVKEDYRSGMKDGGRQPTRFDQSTEINLDQPATWAEDSSAQVQRKLANLKSITLDKVFVATKTMEQEIDHSLNRYNVKVQNLADQVPGDFGRNAARYPWVTISISLAIGLVVGMFLSPARRSRLHH